MIPSPDWSQENGLYSLSFIQDEDGVVFKPKDDIKKAPGYEDIPYFQEMRPALDWMAENMANACQLCTTALPTSVLARIKKRTPTRQKVDAPKPPEKN